MTWKVERRVTNKGNGLALSGRIREEGLPDVKAALGNEAYNTSIDLEEVTVVDQKVVRFLSDLEAAGAQLLHCPPYIRQWIIRERAFRADDE